MDGTAPLLYHLGNDLSEKRDLAAAEPQRAARRPGEVGESVQEVVAWQTMNLLLLALIGIISSSSLTAQDVIVYGGTPSGIAAAISAAQQRRSVASPSLPGSDARQGRVRCGGNGRNFLAAVLRNEVGGLEHW